jgi:hypothetical protein
MRLTLSALVLVLALGCSSGTQATNDEEANKAASKQAEEAHDEASLYRNNLLQLGMGLGDYVATYNAMPGVDRSFLKPDFLPGLSWRVHLLDYLGESALRQKFRLDEPWDSEHNSKLIPEMPEIFRSPGAQVGKTSVHVFVGEGTAFGADWSKQISMRDITDGGSVTVAFVLAGPETAEEWTKPGGVQFAPSKGVERLGTPPTEYGFPVAFFDKFAKPAFIPADISAEAFDALVTPNDAKGSQLALNHINPAELTSELSSETKWKVEGQPMSGQTLRLKVNEPQNVTGELTVQRSLLPGDEYPEHMRKQAMNNAQLQLRVPDTNGMTTHQLNGRISDDGLTVTFQGRIQGLRESGSRQATVTTSDYANPIARQTNYVHQVVVVGRFPVEVRSASEE